MKSEASQLDRPSSSRSRMAVARGAPNSIPRLSSSSLLPLAFEVSLFLYVVVLCSTVPLVRAQSTADQTSSSVTSDRLSVFNQVLQDLIAQQANNTAVGQPLNVSLPGFDASATIVKINVSTLVSSGYSLFEFRIPAGVGVETNLSQIILYYRKLGASSIPYSPPSTTTEILPPVIGLQAYTNLSFSESVSVLASSSNPINVTLEADSSLLDPVCATFTQNGTADSSVSILSQGNNLTTCGATTLGDFAIIYSLETLPLPAPAPIPAPSPIPSPAPAPVPIPSLAPTPGPSEPASVSEEPPPSPPSSPPPPPPNKKSSNNGLAVGLGVGIPLAVILLLLLCLFFFLFSRRNKERRLDRMTTEAERGVPLGVSNINGSRAPIAGSLRTRARLEGENMSPDRV